MGTELRRGEMPHHCRPPMDEIRRTLPSSLSADGKAMPFVETREPPVGTVWRCDCGRLWEVWPNSYVNIFKHGDWRRAGWITRFKYRGK